jgi:hypothetical protein
MSAACLYPGIAVRPLGNDEDEIVEEIATD